MKLKLKKCLDLNIAGAVTDSTIHSSDATLCAIYPGDYPGFKPKTDVNQGDTVLIGSPLMHHKDNPQVKLTSPVAGTVKAIVRGDRRKIIRVEIEPAAPTSRQFDTSVLTQPADALRLLSESGLLALIRQRPYDIVPDPAVMPRDIFVTAFDTAPLAPALESSALTLGADLQAGIDLLKPLCKNNIYISTRPGTRLPALTGATWVEVTGAHPAGNPGVQAANIAPVNKGETIWTLDITTLAKIAILASQGRRDASAVIAVTGPEVATPCLIHTCEGADIKSALAVAGLKPSDHHTRIISGNVLTGEAVDPDGFIHFPYRQLTVIAEGDDKTEFMGWASFSPAKASQSPTFPGHFSSRPFTPDARINGGRRAMIMSGEYDRVMPMDILPEYLLKAIIGRDIDAMEKLGIYEVAPEDFSAAEYVDTSKLPLQQIVRDGLDYLRASLE